ncbi:uncharacterized protein [Palaemon carinicauda]|uniref:uncharacterized protein n=1 Tax=Palaemon carinicauda TaxID=392227 RepID=UPI0035B6847B
MIADILTKENKESDDMVEVLVKGRLRVALNEDNLVHFKNVAVAGRARLICCCVRDHLMEVRNCKVINGESVAVQHRLVVIDCRLRSCRSKKTRMDPKIKWWKLKEEELRVLFKERVLKTVKLHEDVQEWWTENSKVILRIGEEVREKSSGKRPPKDKESWWRNDEMQERVKT